LSALIIDDRFEVITDDPDNGAPKTYSMPCSSVIFAGELELEEKTSGLIFKGV
jgi:hypothetical protein